jgi:hypothetical protein
MYQNEPAKNASYISGVVDIPVPQPDNRRHCAFHEASHAVLMYYFGGQVSHEGVEIDARQYCGYAINPLTHTAKASICVSLAGWGAEMRFAPQFASSLADGELLYFIYAAEDVVECFKQGRIPEPDEIDDADADNTKVFARLMLAQPYASYESLIAAFRAYEKETADLLARPEIWESIERVSNALLEHGKLLREEVEDLLDPGVKDGVFRE